MVMKFSALHRPNITYFRSRKFLRFCPYGFGCDALRLGEFRRSGFGFYRLRFSCLTLRYLGCRSFGLRFSLCCLSEDRFALPIPDRCCHLLILPLMLLFAFCATPCMAILGNAGIAVEHTALDIDGKAGSIDGAAELHQEAVTHHLEDAPLMLGNGGVKEFPAM